MEEVAGPRWWQVVRVQAVAIGRSAAAAQRELLRTRQLLVGPKQALMMFVRLSLRRGSPLREGGGGWGATVAPLSCAAVPRGSIVPREDSKHRKPAPTYGYEHRST